MDNSKKKLVEQLQQLQQQVIKLKEAYLAQVKPFSGKNPREKVTAREPDVSVLRQDEELTEKDQKLLAQTLRTGKESELYKAVTTKLKTLIGSGKTTFSVSALKEIQEAMDQVRGKTNNWEIFRHKFSGIHQDFFDKLREAHPDLTKTEQKFCAFIRIHMNSAQIASVLNVSKEAIRKNRYRIRKKFGLNTADSLEEYINRF